MHLSLRAALLPIALVAGSLAEARQAAPPGEQGPVLWGALSAGMSRHDVDRAVRHRPFGLTDLCAAIPAMGYSRGRLVSLTLTARNSDNAGPLCAERVRATLAAQYGPHDAKLERALEDRAWIYDGPSTLPRLVGSIDPSRVAFDAWSTPDKSVLFTSARRSGRWKILFVPNARPVPNPTQL